MNIIDKNFTIQYTVTVKFDTKNKKMYKNKLENQIFIHG